MRALDEKEFPYSDLTGGIEIYDWGCGQGIGTMAVIEKLRQHNMLRKLCKVVLEEPSNVARDRAVIHVKKALEDYNAEISSDLTLEEKNLRNLKTHAEGVISDNIGAICVDDNGLVWMVVMILN
jgi:hypothetical protein